VQSAGRVAAVVVGDAPGDTTPGVADEGAVVGDRGGGFGEDRFGRFGEDRFGRFSEDRFGRFSEDRFGRFDPGPSGAPLFGSGPRDGEGGWG
jgi:hypothetical protein